MFKFLRYVFKKSEIRLFKLLRFDSPTYDYSVPKSGNEQSLHLMMVESYFNEQPGFFRIAVTAGYLFTKKATKFALRKIIGVLK